MGSSLGAAPRTSSSRLTRARNAVGLSQSQAARALGLYVRKLREIEHGILEPTAGQSVAIAALYGISAADVTATDPAEILSGILLSSTAETRKRCKRETGKTPQQLHDEMQAQRTRVLARYGVQP